MSLEQWSYIATILGVVVAVIGFPFIAFQLRIARLQRLDAIRLSTGQVLLAADAVLATHADVAAKLRPGGDWAGKYADTHPTNEELALVEPYMGAFERIFIAYRAGQLDDEILDQLYGYRLANIWANPRIVDVKLQNALLKKFWKRFIGLTFVLEAYRGERFPLHTDTYFPADLFDHRPASKILERLRPR